MSNKVLIVEDNLELAGIFRDYLAVDGFETQLLHSGSGVVEAVRQFPPDIILMDMSLPGVDGIEICRQIREFSTLPIIVVSARVDEMDRLLGLNIGADDYVCKPVSPKEIVARVNALLRRLNWTKEPQSADAGLQIDDSQSIASWNNKNLKLTPIEFRLLKLLARRSQIYSRAALMNVIYDDGRFVNDRTVDSHIRNLRLKLTGITQLKNPIRSIYGIGYQLDLSE